MGTDKLKILFITPYFRPYIGGIERAIEELSHALFKTGTVAKIGVITTKYSFPRIPHPEWPDQEIKIEKARWGRSKISSGNRKVEIPKEIDDAAYIDGCNPIQAIYKIYLPLIIPGIVATAILNGIWVWNELAIALGLTFFAAQPITVGVASFRGYASINWGGMTGSAIVSMIPMILFAAFAQKHIVKGLTLGSVKG